ncbi:MAG: hypothetical protein M5U20_05700 [Phycisphaerales bacterium]|nr:hypothetical protein [Phycisphaerales bacterium]
MNKQLMLAFRLTCVGCLLMMAAPQAGHASQEFVPPLLPNKVWNELGQPILSPGGGQGCTCYGWELYSPPPHGGDGLWCTFKRTCCYDGQCTTNTHLVFTDTWDYGQALGLCRRQCAIVQTLIPELQ